MASLRSYNAKWTIFSLSQIWHSQTGGRGTGCPRLGKNSHIFAFFWGGASLKHFVFVYLQDVQGVRKMCQPKNFLVSPKICTDGEKNSTSVPDMLAAFCISGHKRHPAVTSSMNRTKENDDYIFLFPGRKFRKPPTVPFILLSCKQWKIRSKVSFGGWGESPSCHTTSRSCTYTIHWTLGF